MFLIYEIGACQSAAQGHCDIQQGKICEQRSTVPGTEHVLQRCWSPAFSTLTWHILEMPLFFYVKKNEWN